ncbi:hypothetical protein [uncultured Duncaniella sp.]|uniref:hypothetical protein n=1 Tax=uncultured Duncaniella sp. TaxID=2768039 RepID=UPI00261B59ED|nr:hypothetical protein [uncultured Duncaniella sp.]
MLDFIFGSPITIVVWIIGSIVMARYAYKYNRALNELHDAEYDHEKTMNSAPTWLRTINEYFTVEDLQDYTFMNIGLPYVHGCFERFAPECFRLKTYESGVNPSTGQIIYGTITSKEDWFKVYQYLKMAEDLSPYSAIPVITEDFGLYKEFCPNKLYAKFHSSIGFKYVPCDRNKLLFENSHWPKPIGSVFTFSLAQGLTPLSFNVHMIKYGEPEIWSGIEIKKMRRVYEIPTSKMSGYHFPAARTSLKDLKQAGMPNIIRTYKGDHLLRLSDITTFSCDISGLRVVIPRPSDHGNSFDTCGGHIVSSKPRTDGTYEVSIGKLYRKYFKNADSIWVDLKYLYVWLDKKSFKVLDPDSGEHDQVIIGKVLGSDGAEIRYAFGDIYITRDMRELGMKYPNVIEFKDSIRQKFNLYMLYVNNMIYVCNNMKLYNPIGVHIWSTTDDTSAPMSGPSVIISSTDETYTLGDISIVPKEFTFFALEYRYYSKFGSCISEKNTGIRLLGKLKDLDFWLLMNVEATGDMPVFYVVSSTQYEHLSSGRNMFFINPDNGAIRIFYGDIDNIKFCDQIESLPANTRLKYVYDRSRCSIMAHTKSGWVCVGESDVPQKQPQQPEQVQQDMPTSAFLSLVHDVDSLISRSNSYRDITIPPAYSGSSSSYKKLVESEDRYKGAPPIEELEQDPDYVFVDIPFELISRPGSVSWGTYHEYLFYVGTGNTMAYDIYHDRVVFKTMTSGKIAIKIGYCPDYSVHHNEEKDMEVVSLLIPDSLICPIRQAFLSYAARGLFSPPRIIKTKYRINESLAYQAMESHTSYRYDDRYGDCRSDILYPGLIINDEYVSRLNFVHYSQDNETILVSHLDKMTDREKAHTTDIIPFRNVKGELVQYVGIEKEAATISYSILTMKSEIKFIHNAVYTPV